MSLPRCAVLMLGLTCLAGCEATADPRGATVVDTLVRQDLPLLRSRPALVAGKYQLMASDLYAFYRGSFGLWLRDARDGAQAVSRSRFASDAALPLVSGDPHPENFGLLMARDGSFGLEPNDFDAADRYPYYWDLRRLLTGLVIAARASNDGAPDAALLADLPTLAAGWSTAYAAEIQACHQARISDDEPGAVMADLVSRAHRDAADRAELTDDTVLEGGVRRLRRGVLDPADPTASFEELSPSARAALPGVLAGYRDSLIAPPDAATFQVLDAVRELGSGVASWPRIRALVLVRGPSDAPDDDVIYEVKELSDSGAGGLVPPGVLADSLEQRVTLATRALWSIPDAAPLWGTSRWLGLPVQVRLESSAQKGVKVKRLTGARATSAAFADLGGTLARRLARLHCAPINQRLGATGAIVAAVARDPAGFASEQAEVALLQGDRVMADFALFRAQLARLGPTLGVPAEDVRAGADARDFWGGP